MKAYFKIMIRMIVQGATVMKPGTQNAEPRTCFSLFYKQWHKFKPIHIDQPQVGQF